MEFKKVSKDDELERWEAALGDRQYTIQSTFGSFLRVSCSYGGRGVSIGCGDSFKEAVRIAEAYERGVTSQPQHANTPKDTATCAMRQINILAVWDVLHNKSAAVFSGVEKAAQATCNALTGTPSGYFELRNIWQVKASYHHGFHDAVMLAIKTITKEARKNEQTRTSATDKADE